MDINLTTTRLFKRNLESQKRYIVNRGSSGSSKSWSILQVLIYKFLTEKNKRILILRKTLPSLRDSAHTWFLQIIGEMGLVMGEHIKEEKQFLNYFYGTNEIRFRSLDDREKIKSSSYHYIFLEEATDFAHPDFEMLDLYLRAPSKDEKRNQMFLAFNPIDELHWLKTKLVDVEDDLDEIHSTYNDNPFYPKDNKIKLEKLAYKDPNLYRIYTLGEWGREGNLIFRNWKIIKEPIPENADLVGYGIDFGFTNDKTAVVKVYEDKEDNTVLYVEEHLYKKDMLTRDIANRLKLIIGDDEKIEPIYADCANPDKIKEIRKEGFNIKPSKKGKHSVKNGIDFLRTYTILVPDYCINLIKEFQSYSWKTDKDGEPTNEPVDFNSHLLDALRYCVYTRLSKQKNPKFQWLK